MARQGQVRNGAPLKGPAAQARQQTRKPSPQVYRRRRIVVAVLLLLILAGLCAAAFAVAGALGPHGGTAPAAPSAAGSGVSPQAAAIPASAPPTSATPGCDGSKVTITVSTDAAVYKGRENPIFSLKVTNSGTTPCEVNLGTSQMEFLVSSGEDRVFSSKDCQDGGQDLMKVIPPGGTETANFPWTRTRSLPGCAKTASTPGAGGSTYVLVAKLGARTSPKTVFQLG